MESDDLNVEIKRLINRLKHKKFLDDNIKKKLIDELRLIIMRIDNIDSLLLGNIWNESIVCISNIRKLLDDNIAIHHQVAEDIMSWILKLENNIQLINERRNYIAHNSDAFYKKQIEDLNQQIQELNQRIKNTNQINDELRKLNRDRAEITAKLRDNEVILEKERLSTHHNREEAKRLEAENQNFRSKLSEYGNKIKELNEQQREYKSLRVELEKTQQSLLESKKQNDIKQNWNEKIKQAFDNLSIYLRPIIEEKERLNFLYYGFLFLSFLLIIFLGYFECVIICQIREAKVMPTLQQYLYIILPIPIALGLLWGFITQMNRAQRQLVILTKHMHEINYIEGLLLTLNTLSIDVNDSIKKVNNAIDKMLEIHLYHKTPELINEDSLSKELKKDALPIETVEKIMKILLSNK